ncbi:Bgt-60027 [Blumeria graminis f. sp. tritici]|uniref:Bgt-60027 n=2 Tax=Blumeria graminis f. sp. tritici TaxID=62690 RepID=A0A9X9MM89_BLUGR|nr:Bgt-60027 [Blumeria graminis f. sp. tritici]
MVSSFLDDSSCYSKDIISGSFSKVQYQSYSHGDFSSPFLGDSSIFYVAFAPARSPVVVRQYLPVLATGNIGFVAVTNGVVIEPADQIRWLGIHLDPRLDFKHHVTTWCGKALKVAQQMRRLNSAYRGAAPAALVRTVDTCVVPVATVGADVWWPGLKRPTKRGIITLRTSIFCKMIDKAILTGLRAALPVTRTTPNLALHREGGIPTRNIILEGNRLRLSARLHSLDNRHPL